MKSLRYKKINQKNKGEENMKKITFLRELQSLRKVNNLRKMDQYMKVEVVDLIRSTIAERRIIQKINSSNIRSK